MTYGLDKSTNFLCSVCLITDSLTFFQSMQSNIEDLAFFDQLQSSSKLFKMANLADNNRFCKNLALCLHGFWKISDQNDIQSSFFRTFTF